MTSKPLTEQEFICEAILWRLEHATITTTAGRLRVHKNTLVAALERAGTYSLWFPLGKRRGKRTEIFCVPESVRLRWCVPWHRAYLTNCDLIYPQGVDRITAIRAQQPPLMWQCRFDWV